MIRIAFAAAALTLAAAPFAVSAQQGPMGGMGQMGPMTLAQMQESSDARFAALDVNHDGVLSAAEASPPRVRGDRGPGIMAPGGGMERADANHDGNITLEEYRAMTAGMFARLDANRDGTVTPDELQAMRGMMPPPGMGGPGGPGGPGGMGMEPDGGMPGMPEPDGD